MANKVTAVVGGQFGSEGKGTVVASIAHEYDVHCRVGGPNAGHSFWHGDQLFKMQSIPCGWINPDAQLVIGAGAVVDLEQLYGEAMDIISRAGMSIWHRLFIDGNATVITSAQKSEEGGVDGELHQRIGSTGKGVGAARLGRINRDPSKAKLFKDVAREYEMDSLEADTARMLRRYDQDGANILFEGTQGAHLSLVHGPWPYVTSGDTNAAQMCADFGFPPTLMTDTILVVRTYPIRVWGNSGPLRNEITWEKLSERIGRPVTEQTTVTHKTRRVGEWDEELLLRALIWNNPSSIGVNFLDYISPEDEGKTDYSDLSSTSKQFIQYVETITDTPVEFVGTGGPRWSVIRREV